MSKARRAKHYVVQSGESGCLPEAVYGCESFQNAVDGCVESFSDLISEREATRMRFALESYKFYKFKNPAEAGADYCEITECTCAAGASSHE